MRNLGHQIPLVTREQTSTDERKKFFAEKQHSVLSPPPHRCPRECRQRQWGDMLLCKRVSCPRTNSPSSSAGSLLCLLLSASPEPCIQSRPWNPAWLSCPLPEVLPTGDTERPSLCFSVPGSWGGLVYGKRLQGSLAVSAFAGSDFQNAQFFFSIPQPAGRGMGAWQELSWGVEKGKVCISCTCCPLPYNEVVRHGFGRAMLLPLLF